METTENASLPAISTTTASSHWRAAGLVVLIATGVRAAAFWIYVDSPLRGLLLADQRFYWNWGVRISLGDWVGQGAFHQGPLYAYLLGTIFSFLGPVEIPVLCLQLTVGVITCLLVYDSALRLFDPVTALIAGVIASLYGPFVFYECMIMKTFLSPFLTTVALWSSLRYAGHRSWKWMFLAGVSVGLACLLRENHLLLLLPIVWWCWRVNRLDLQRPRGRFPRHIAALIAAFALVIAPCAVRNAAVTGEFIAVTAGGGEVLYIAHGPDAMGYYNAPPFIRPDTRFEHGDFQVEAMRRKGHPLTAAGSSRYWFHEALLQMYADPLRALRLSGVKAMILLNNFEVPDSSDYQMVRQRIAVLRWLPSFGWLCGLGVLGMIVCGSRPEFRLPLGLLLCHAVTVILLYNFGRFRLGMLPLWILFSARGITWLGQHVTRKQITFDARILVAAALVIGLSVFSCLPPIGFDRTDYASQSQEASEAIDQRARRLPQLGPLRSDAATESGPRVTARLTLAHALLEVGDEDGAERVYRDILRENENRSDVRLELAVLLTARGRYDESMRDLRRVLRDNPEHTIARLHLAEAIRGNSPQALAEAAEELEAALRFAPGDPQPRLQLAVIRFQQGRSEEADRHLDVVLQSFPRHPAAFRLRENFHELQQ